MGQAFSCRHAHALDAISGLATEVTRLSTSGQDVTEEFVDLDARLGNLEATAARLRTFLDESRNVEEALAVNMELSRVEGEIESLKGRMQYLQQSAAFSSINVDVTPDVLAQPIQVTGWQPTGVAKQAIEALVAALQSLGTAAIWFVPRSQAIKLKSRTLCTDMSGSSDATSHTSARNRRASRTADCPSTQK